jgi:hypothetical protein
MTPSHPGSHGRQAPPSGAHFDAQPDSYPLNPAATTPPLTLPTPAALIPSLPPHKTTVSFSLIRCTKQPIVAPSAPIRR